jgi:branched-chain amino acid transport system permease protein
MPDLFGLLSCSIGAEYRAATAFAVLIAILLVRPTGLFGEKP